MALPLTEPDPLAWRVALRLAKSDPRRLKVSDDGLSVWVLNSPLPDRAPARELSWDTAAALMRAAQRAPAVPVLELELVRAAGGTHLVRAWSDYALCGARIVGPWTTGQELSCPTCTTILPPEA